MGSADRQEIQGLLSEVFGLADLLKGGPCLRAKFMGAHEPGDYEGVARVLRLCAEILRERIDQDKQWGGPSHDDGLYPVEWRDIMVKHLRRGYQDADGGKRLDLWRRALVKVAALALAALESHDRMVARQEVPRG